MNISNIFKKNIKKIEKSTFNYLFKIDIMELEPIHFD